MKDTTTVLALVTALLTAHLVVRTRTALLRRRPRRSPRTKGRSTRRVRRSFADATQYLNASQFARSYVLPRRVFFALVDTLRPSLTRNADQAARSSGGVIEPAVRLGLTLRMLAGASYFDLVTNFNISPTSVYTIFHNTVCAICAELPMPGVPIQDEQKLRSLSEGFRTSRAHPNPLFGCVGALDGIAIRLMKPHDVYFPRKIFCRKDMHALPLQALVSSDYKFMYMSVRCAGSTNDCIAFGVSGLARRLQSIGLLPGYWIAGDAAYECRHGVITPWPKAALMCPEYNNSRDAFNFFQSSSRVHVEQTFGMLVARFGILWKPLRFDLANVPNILSACFRLHNLCVDNGVPPVQHTLNDDELHAMEKAFAEWWRCSRALRDETTRSGRPAPDEHCATLRAELTDYLRRNGICRP